MSAILPPKNEVALALLERASIFIHLDPRQDGVMVPAWLKSQPQLVLQVGLNMAVQIPDLDVADDSISCTLSFSRRPEFCRVPWSAIYALVGEDGRGMIWPDDIPAEVAAQTNQPAALRSVDGSSGKSKASSNLKKASEAKLVPERRNALLGQSATASAAVERRPKLVALPGAKTEQESGASPVRQTESARPHLRLVK